MTRERCAMAADSPPLGTSSGPGSMALGFNIELKS
jgi:hypothetical protein